MQNESKVKMWVEEVELPAYKAAEPNKNPMFLEKRIYQGSSGKIYPLPFTDKIYDEKAMEKYEAVFLENRYLKIMIMPQMGGKIYRAYDKTNDYDFVYYNRVVKPALVGLTGPWVSGGIEFNWPQHHRPSTFSPVEYSLEENEDGSKTCWISEIDRMYGTKGMAGFTLYEDKAYIEIKGQLYNRTELPQTFLWWANPAVSVNEYTKSIFPPDVHAVYDHGKRDVSSFPIATGVYYKTDYTSGVDISRYKNIPVPTSYMAYKSDYNFVGGYDFSVDAGILHVADHHISPGKKQWTWGNGDFGQAWDRNLTDDDGPYIELMTGVFTDNQPDFSWMAPKEEKTFKQYFMPYKKIGEVKNVTIDSAINMELSESCAELMLYTTSVFRDVRVVLTEAGRIVYSEVIPEVSPVKVYEKKVSLEKVQSEYLYKLSIYNSEGRLMISYQPAKPEKAEIPEPAKAAKLPGEIASTEELFLTGLHLEQYRHATYEPSDYYLEALRREPSDIRNNNAYGLLLYRRGHFAESEKYFRKAIETLTDKNTNPYDGEPYYNLGLSLKMQGRLDEAFDAFYKSIWNGTWQDSGFFELAQIAAIRGNYPEALELVDKSIVRNYHNIKARNLKAAILRKMGRNRECARFVQETIGIDILDFGAKYELSQLYEQSNDTAKYDEANCEFTKIMRGNSHNYLELAMDYGSAGFYEEAVNILKSYAELPEAVANPLVYYYAGYYLRKNGQLIDSDVYYTKAAQQKPDYCFPNNLMSILVLEDAVTVNKADSKALYYLGNLYYDKKQYDKAMSLWESSIKIDSSFATVQRNLALAYVNKKGDLCKGLGLLEMAFSLDETDGRVLYELDQLYKKTGRAHQERLSLLNKSLELVHERDDLYIEYVTLINQTGNFEKAVELIDQRHFHPWEGGEGKVTAQYKYCRVELAKKSITNKEYSKAIALLEECKVYPHNLGEGKLAGTAENDLTYYLGRVFAAKGELEKARSFYELASVGLAEPTDMMFYNDQPADMIFYQGLALQCLGRTAEAVKRFDKLIDYGGKHFADKVKIDYFAVSLPDFLVFEEDLDRKNKVHCNYLTGLGYMGKNEPETAGKYLKKALELNINHQGVQRHLNMLTDK